ncbi:TIGR01777 family oxidoreductase [Hydrogenovibrio halophilus]|uniref:TIGR01777 family oxidoreductase n=1 Tax=Hydrogenovibrio halophilus TaxID=373391 RepID=UPI00037632BA|nr:TIGR01777 family oxidoreductase [Hydrogenovibrio halophilus]
MKMVITGGTGLVGQALARHFSSQHQVTAYGRDAFDVGFDLADALSGADVLIHLSGANIGKRWHKGYEDELWHSRIDTTHALTSALNTLDPEQRPQRIISTSAIGFYPENTCDQPQDERQTQPGTHFLARLSQAWEEAARQLSDDVLIFRFGVVLDAKGGALAKMLPAFRLGLGGPVAGGNQCFSWIALDDLVRGFDFALSHPELSGCINLTAPTPVRQREFGQTLAKTLKRPFGLPLPAWQLKLMFGRGAQVLMLSHAVLPTRLQEAGFVFNWPTPEAALTHLLTNNQSNQ